MPTNTTDLRDELATVAELVSTSRTERKFLAEDFERKRSAWATNGKGFQAVEKAKAELVDKEAEIKSLEDRQLAALETVAGRSPRMRPSRDGNGPQSGDGPAIDGYARAAQELNLKENNTRVAMHARDLMQPALAGVSVTPSEALTSPSIATGFVPTPTDRRLLYPVFARANVEPGDLALTEYRQVGAATVTGDVERDPMSVEEKAKIGLAVELVTPSLRQFAAVADEVPSKLFDAIDVFYSFLQYELRYQLDLAVDSHCLAQIIASAPAHGKSGATLIEKTRNAVAAMRELGANPTVLALSPTDAAALDVQKTDLAYIFATRDTGSASPLWGLTVIESPKVTAPILIDPGLIGVLYAETGAILADPYTEMSKNLVRVRIEIDALFHVRAAAGAYLIE
jgi:hypothetical protein